MVEEGKPAPDFSLTSDAGETVTLASLRGKPVVLYFYPKDDTPGCTTQACGIRDAWGEFERSGAVVLGVSPDSEASHVKFKEKYELPFTLLADPDHATAEAYGVWVEKSMYGKTYMGVERSTFVIAADGTRREGDAARSSPTRTPTTCSRRWRRPAANQRSAGRSSTTRSLSSATASRSNVSIRGTTAGFEAGDRRLRRPTQLRQLRLRQPEALPTRRHLLRDAGKEPAVVLRVRKARAEPLEQDSPWSRRRAWT